MAKQNISELGERIGRALEKLGGKVSDLRRESIEAHLASVASNLEADVADRGVAAEKAKALAADALKKAEEAQRLAEEADAAAGGVDESVNNGSQDVPAVKSKKVLFKEFANAGKEDLLKAKAEAESVLQQNPHRKDAQNTLEVVIELLKK